MNKSNGAKKKTIKGIETRYSEKAGMIFMYGGGSYIIDTGPMLLETGNEFIDNNILEPNKGIDYFEGKNVNFNIVKIDHNNQKVIYGKGSDSLVVTFEELEKAFSSKLEKTGNTNYFLIRKPKSSESLNKPADGFLSVIKQIGDGYDRIRSLDLILRKID